MVPGEIHTIPVTWGARAGGYDVLVGRGLLARLGALLADRVPAHRYAIVSDSTVAGLYGEAVLSSLEASSLRADLFTFPAGEKHKTRSTWMDLTDRLLGAGLGRDACVVALGGGVTGDLAGFVAATYMRGVPVVQVPTSMVAMIDASVGGKTGVDLEVGKNLVGAFHPPRLVVIDPTVVGTLPREERAQGLVEAVKHGAILDEAYLDVLLTESAALLNGDVEPVERAVARSVQLKAEIVSADEREAGRREILNFGHTLGHAVEAACSYDVPHGTAVGLGMVLEAGLGERLGVTESGTADRLRDAVATLGVPLGLPDGATPLEIMTYLGLDKKARQGRTRFVLLSRVGLVHEGGGAWSHPVDEDLVLDSMSSVVAKG